VKTSNSLTVGSLRKKPYAVLVHGAPRSLLLRFTYAFARANDPDLYWVDVRDSADRVDPPGPVELGWIPNDHLFILSRSEAKPHDALSNLALWTVIRSDEPRAVLGDLTDFLRLPSGLQEVLGAYGREDDRPIFVIANADRVRSHYPRTTEEIRVFVDSMLNAGVTPVFATLNPSGAGRFAYDLLLDVEARDEAHWRDGTVQCERSFPGAPFQPGSSVRLESFAEVNGLLDGRMGSVSA
jgi:hypothetical protein